MCGKCPNEIKTVLRQMAPGFNVQQQEEVPSKHRCKEEKTTLNAYVLLYSVVFYDLLFSVVISIFSLSIIDFTTVLSLVQ